MGGCGLLRAVSFSESPPLERSCNSPVLFRNLSIESKVQRSNSLLNTREAARFLRVSEASIRRWSDAGLLVAQRVGRRRERRFAADDLRHFLENPPGGARGPASEVSTVNVGGAAVPLRAPLAPSTTPDLAPLRPLRAFRAGRPRG